MPDDRAQQVKNWWGKHVNTRPVWRADELPETWYKKVLIDELQTGYEVRRDTLILGKPNSEITELLCAHYWETLATILEPYKPYAIGGIGAIKYYMEDRSISKALNVSTRSSNTRIEIAGEWATVVIEKNSEFFNFPNSEKWFRELETSKGYKICLETPESLLIRIRPRVMKDYPEIVASFMKGVEFNLENLRDMLVRENKPVVFLRLATYFEQFGRIKEADLIRRIVKSRTDYNPPGASTIFKYRIPTTLMTPKTLSDQPFVTRFREQLRYYADAIAREVFVQTATQNSIADIVKNAEETRKYDAYHSSTIEGYRVSVEEIQALVEGRPIVSAGSSPEEIERKMALKGYLEAHRFVLKKIEADFNWKVPMSGELIKEIFAHLFLPTVEAGLLDKETLTRYRNLPVYIRHSRYVPPNHEKVDALMSALVEELNKIQNALTRAILAHYGFVTVHPYKDGNGRVARFLMNYILCTSGFRWVTIRVEDQEPYFKALEAAQVDEDVRSLTNFLARYFPSTLGAMKIPKSSETTQNNPKQKKPGKP